MSVPESVMPTADLAMAFAPPDRTAGLHGLRRHRPDVTPAPKVGVDAKESGERATTSRPAPRPSAAVETPQRSVTVYVPIELRAAVIEERDQIKAAGDPATTAGIVLKAVEAVLPALDELTAPAPTPGSGLFTHRDKAARAPAVQLGMRLASADLFTLDRLAEQHCDGNRSQLVEHALGHRYPSRRI